jgi:dienelactone hydrolase
MEMRRHIVMLIAWMALAGAAAAAPKRQMNWDSPSVEKGVALEVLTPDRAASTKEPPPVVIYLKGLATPRIGTEGDETILADFLKDGFVVVTVDYAGAAKAAPPHLNADLLKLRTDVARIVRPLRIHPDRIYIVPAGYRMVRDIKFFWKGGRTWQMDVRYPSRPAKPVPLAIQIPHNNDHRMNGAAFTKYKDSLLDGLLTRGYAGAVVDHPVAPPYRGIDLQPDAMHKLKAAIRTLRARAKPYHLDAKHFGVLGFSRGSGMAAMLATTGDIAELEGEGPNPRHSSRVQAALVLAGRMDHKRLREDGISTSTWNRYVAAWGNPAKNAGPWDRASASSYVTRDDPPTFLCVGGRDAYRTPQIRRFAKVLKAAGVEHELVEEPGKGHVVTTDPKTIRAIYDFFDSHLRK